MSGKPLLPHSWNLSPKEAVQLQRQLRELVRTDLSLKSAKRIAGVDVAYRLRSKQSIATVVILSYPSLETLEASTVKVKTRFPYIPGLLSFREIPPILKAMDKLSAPPDLIFVDGHGRAHPRRLGIASHLGLWLKRPHHRDWKVASLRPVPESQCRTRPIDSADPQE